MARKTVQFQSTLPVWGATQQVRGIGDIKKNFNPRSPCGERRTRGARCAVGAGFQSTLPVWGATRHDGRGVHPRPHFNPRSPCGERLVMAPVCAALSVFQSTLPVWGATLSRRHPVAAGMISIHAPRVGSDDA